MAAMAYMIATGYGPKELQQEVNRLLALGWVPVGGVAVEPSHNGLVAVYSQAMTFSQAPMQAEPERNRT